MTVSIASKCEEIWLEGADGARIFVRYRDGGAQTVASLVICHGVNSHSGHYVRAAEAFAARGLAVTALDLRGRGKSDGERFYVEGIDDYVSDVSQTIELARSRNPGVPLFLLGHSAGGVTAVTYALDHQEQIDGLICESFAFRVYAPNFALKLLEGVSHFFPHAHVLRLKMDDFSRDPEWVATLKADPLTDDEVQPVQTVAAFARAGERFEREFGRITLPVLILHGTADKATRPDGSQQFYAEAGSPDKTLKLYDGYFHDLLNDEGCEIVMDDIVAWIEARLPPIERPAIPLTA